MRTSRRASSPVNRYCADGLMRFCRLCKAALDAQTRKRKISGAPAAAAAAMGLELHFEVQDVAQP